MLPIPCKWSALWAHKLSFWYFFSLEFGVLLHLRDTDLSDLVRLNSLFEHSLDGIITVCPDKIRGTFLHHSPNYTPPLIILKSVTSATLLQNEVAADKRK